MSKPLSSNYQPSKTLALLPKPSIPPSRPYPVRRDVTLLKWKIEGEGDCVIGVMRSTFWGMIVD